MKSKQRRFLKWKHIIFIAILIALGICAYSGYTALAADGIFLEVSGVDVTNTLIEQRQREIQLDMRVEGQIYDDPRYIVTWTIEGAGDGVIARVDQSPNFKHIALVTALSPGRVRITVTVQDGMDPNGAVLASTGCDIEVIFAVDTTTDDSIYKYIYSDSTEKALVLYTNDLPKSMLLNFGESSDAQWMSANTDVASVNQYSGQVTPVGAGYTTITATYTPSGATQAYEAVLPVYVIPRITDSYENAGNGRFATALSAGMDRGEFLYLDTFFGENNLQSLGEKVIWVIKQENGAGGYNVIANSLNGGPRSDLISLAPNNSRSSMLEVQAKAGRYFIEFYTAGTYESEARKTTAYSPTVVELSVYASFGNYEETMMVGDSYLMANAFNLTVEDYRRYFFDPVITYGGGDSINYADYNETTTSINTKASALLDVRVNPRTAYIREIEGLTNPESSVYGSTIFDIKLNIIDSFGLDRISHILSVGDSYNLRTIMSDTIEGTVTWETSNRTYVTVDGNGRITGVRATTGIPDIIITASLRTETGAIIKNATCSVKVEPAMANFNLVPSTLSMKVGDITTVKADLGNQMVSEASLVWTAMDPSIITVEAAADRKSAVVTARKGGSTTIIVTNTKNNMQKYVQVTVLIAITDIRFEQTVVTMKNMPNSSERTIKVLYTPKDANSTDLVWTSIDPSIATIEGSGIPEDGEAIALIRLHKPGIVNLTVAPRYNPTGTIAMCTLTVLEPVTDLTLQPTNITLNAKYGTKPAETQQLSYSVQPVGATTTVEFISSDPTIASVDENGLVTAVKAGLANITIQTEEGILRNSKVTVLQPCDSISFNPLVFTMNTGATYKPIPVLRPADTTDSLTWRSFNTDIASVDANGLITARKVGNAIIQATATSGASEYLQITVRDGLKSIKLNHDSYTMEVGNTFDLIPEFTPPTAFDKSVKWYVSDSSVISFEEKIDSGIPFLRITGKKGGMAMVTVTTTDGGFIASCLVNIREKSSKVTVTPTTKYLQVKKAFTVTAVVSNATTTNKNVRWSTSKKKVASVTAAGRVKGKKIGTAYIRATASDGSGASAQCRVIVVRKATGIRLNRRTAKMLVGKSLKLRSIIRPNNATIKTVEWTTDNNSIATVDRNGRVHALAPGLVRVRARTTDGSGKYAICLITVSEPVAATGVTVENSELIVARGRHIPSGIVISPENSTDKIKYSSDNRRVARVNKRGKIFTRRRGQVTIYGKTSNGKYGYTDVLVVGMNRRRLQMRKYDTEQLTVNEIGEGVTWFSRNPLIASVTNDGTVTGRRPGTTKIIATVRGLRVRCRVRILDL
ncbi:MAG: Ig-like domain-containing protein [Lachnoclostridium sp.]|jgi:uncharacterized protein YjdB|nr:Ig-like domain-containing protein [Lachnoclostridium sp.]